jgi:hypothetical protein
MEISLVKCDRPKQDPDVEKRFTESVVLEAGCPYATVAG